MLLFRSEGQASEPEANAHISRWAAQRNIAPGATLTVEQGWELARRWYGHRLDEDWRRRTADEAHDVFESLGLIGPFWRLTPPQTTD